MVLGNMYKILEKEGLQKIEAVGKPFDPNLHESSSKVITQENNEGIVVEEVRKGFMFRDRVIRPSIVKISGKEDEEL